MTILLVVVVVVVVVVVDYFRKLRVHISFLVNSLINNLSHYLISWQK